VQPWASKPIAIGCKVFLTTQAYSDTIRIVKIYSASCTVAIQQAWVCTFINAMMPVAIIHTASIIVAVTGIALIAGD
jgi:hypothetical protein